MCATTPGSIFAFLIGINPLTDSSKRQLNDGNCVNGGIIELIFFLVLRECWKVIACIYSSDHDSVLPWGHGNTSGLALVRVLPLDFDAAFC